MNFIWAVGFFRLLFSVRPLFYVSASIMLTNRKSTSSSSQFITAIVSGRWHTRIATHTGDTSVSKNDSIFLNSTCIKEILFTSFECEWSEVDVPLLLFMLLLKKLEIKKKKIFHIHCDSKVILFFYIFFSFWPYDSERFTTKFIFEPRNAIFWIILLFFRLFLLSKWIKWIKASNMRTPKNGMLATVEKKKFSWTFFLIVAHLGPLE